MNYKALAPVTCPYCGKKTEVEVPPREAEKPLRSACSACHHPIAVYSSQAKALRHPDRSIRAIAVEQMEYREGVDYFLEFVENQFAHPQKLRIPLGASYLGRYNAHSTAELQLFTNDPSMDRLHAQLNLKENGTLFLADNQSTTGTFVGTSLLAPREQRRLRDGDVLTFGATSAIVHMPEEEEDDDWLF